MRDAWVEPTHLSILVAVAQWQELNSYSFVKIQLQVGHA